MLELTQKIVSLYQNFDLVTAETLSEVYHHDVHFQDPFHALNGLHNLSAYFTRLSANLDACTFEFTNVETIENKAYMIWVMSLRHRKLNYGRNFDVEGITELRMATKNDACKVLYHRDYFDGGQMLYEQLPVLGAVVKHIKKRL